MVLTGTYKIDFLGEKGGLVNRTQNKNTNNVLLETQPTKRGSHEGQRLVSRTQVRILERIGSSPKFNIEFLFDVWES